MLSDSDAGRHLLIEAFRRLPQRPAPPGMRRIPLPAAAGTGPDEFG
jgi:hypothetical protein